MTIKKHVPAKYSKCIADVILLFSSGILLMFLLHSTITNVNTELEIRDKKIISEVHQAVEALKAPQIGEFIEAPPKCLVMN